MVLLSFLWRVKDNDGTPEVEAFPWTGNNDYIMLTGHDYLALGSE
jgi:hypothetical protein